MTIPTPNTDESLVTTDHPFIGNFHKTLPHNEFGEVDAAAYRRFERICAGVEAGMPINFEDVPKGPLSHAAQTPFSREQNPSDESKALILAVAKFVSPLAGAATEAHGPDPKSLEMLPAPGVQSLTAAAEMAELYWMALLRDAPLLAFQDHPTPPGSGCANLADHDTQLGYSVVNRVGEAQTAIQTLFDCALQHDNDPGKLRTPLDLTLDHAGHSATRQTMFRGGLADEQYGPLVSQFFIRPIGFGTQTIDQKQVPYRAKLDFLTSHKDWLLAQNTGKDKYGRDYGQCNNYADQEQFKVPYYPVDSSGTPVSRYISTMRDLARFVNRDALHQAYFNAALFLDGIGAPLDPGNPYRGNRFTRETPFASLGGPDLLTLVSEVASRALKVVWRQKWLVHRRARPEVYGGLVQMQRKGYGDPKSLRNYGLPTSHPDCGQFTTAFDATLAAVAAHNATFNCGEETYFLPMAFSAGSPVHPAYGAGHATVAGACVTALKAWFDEDAKLIDVFRAANKNAAQKIGPKDPPGGTLQLLQPGYRSSGTDLESFCEPMEYMGADAGQMTVGGELNKIASNVAMGRSMGGVHWRTDNARSLRLGEAIAVEILRKRTLEYAERPVSFTFRAFDRHMVRIANGQVQG
jgi:hypothetical protein